MTVELPVYRPDSNRFDSISIVAKNALAVLEAIEGGTPLPKGARLRWFPADTAGDFPSLSQRIPVLSPRAFAAIEPHLDGCCEPRRIEVDGVQLHALRVTAVVDCLDRRRSELEVFDGVIEAYDRLALRRDRIPTALFFNIKGLEGLELFCHPKLFDLVAENGLSGLLRHSTKLIQ
jgi:hypothetical protein